MDWEIIAHGTDRCQQVGYVIEYAPDADRAYRVRLELLDHKARCEHPDGYFDAFNGELEAITENMDHIRHTVAMHLHERRFAGS